MDTSQLQQLMIGIFGLVLIYSGISIAGKSGKAQYSETARTGFNVGVSIVIVAIGLGGLAYAAFGKKILALLGLA